MQPDGKVVTTFHVAHANTKALLEGMVKVAAISGVKPGKPLVQPTPQSHKPEAPANSLVVHLIARGTGHGSWREFPSEDWLTFSPTEVKAFLPTGEAPSWNVSKPVAEKLLRYFYPQTEQCDDEKPQTNRIDTAVLRGRVETVKNGVVHARLEGNLKMKHAFYPGKEDDRFVEATLAGYIDFDQRTGRIINFRVVTDEATYGKEPIGIVASLSR